MLSLNFSGEKGDALHAGLPEALSMYVAFNMGDTSR